MKAIFTKYTLCNLDILYRDIIKDRSIKERLEYCNSLIFRTKMDTKRDHLLSLNFKRLVLIRAIKREIKHLNKLLKTKNET